MIPVFLVSAWANPIFRKVVLYAAIALAVLYAGYRWLNKHDSRIYQEGRESMAVELEKEKKAEWAAKEKTLAESYLSLQAATEQLAQDRSTIYRTLDEHLRTVKTAAQANSISAAAVPDSALDSAIRAISGELATQP